MKDLLKTVKLMLDEASKVFNRPPYAINRDQFTLISKGKIKQRTVSIFGFTKLRNAVYPSPNTDKAVQQEARKMIERLLKAGTH